MRTQVRHGDGLSVSISLIFIATLTNLNADINLCIGGLFAPVYLFLIPSFKPRATVSNKSLWSTIDYTGIALSVGAYTAGVMAISFGGQIYPWNSARVIALFVVSGVLFITFGIQQGMSLFTTEENRMFPVKFLFSKDLCILFAQVASATTAIFVPIYFIPLYFQFVRGDSALESGIRLLPYIFLMIFFVILNGIVMSKTGYYWPWYTGGAALCIIGSALLYTVDKDSSNSRIYGYSIILAIGGGSFTQASFSVAQAKADPRDTALATGFITCGQLTGATIALAIANSVFLNQASKNILRVLPTASKHAVQAAIAGAGSDFFKNLSGDDKARVLTALVAALNKTYILGITAGAVALVLSLFMKREKLFMEASAA